MEQNTECLYDFKGRSLTESQAEGWKSKGKGHCVLVSFGGDKNTLGLKYCDDCTTLNTLKAVELYALMTKLYVR